MFKLKKGKPMWKKAKKKQEVKIFYLKCQFFFKTR